MSQYCADLHQRLLSLPHHHFPYDAGKIPTDGIYVLFEDGEKGHGADRIVRVGTHTGNKQLHSRLEQHFLRENKDRSIFRKNIGRALLARSGDPYLEQWNINLTRHAARAAYTGQVDAVKREQVERQVSQIIQNHFWFVAFPVPTKDARLMLESKIISTVSLCKTCGPSADWLGKFSPKPQIRESGLWLVNELYQEPFSEDEFKAFSALIQTYRNSIS